MGAWEWVRMIPQDIAEKLAGDMGWKETGGRYFRDDSIQVVVLMMGLGGKLTQAGAFDVLTRLCKNNMAVLLQIGEHEWHCDLIGTMDKSKHVTAETSIRAIEKAVIAYYGEKDG